MERQNISISKIRQFLHQNPGSSNHEKNTAEYLKELVRALHPNALIEDLGGFGFACIFSGTKPGKTLLFRCELDALPLKENSALPHRSSKKNIAHLCGHDGHMAILFSLAKELSQNPPASGKVILMFQPAEETGEGAKRVLDDEKFDTFKPDFVFALHNLPGFPLHSIVIKDGIFASASRGLEIKLTGRTSHAAEPENGKTPVFAVSRLIKELSLLGKNPFIEKYAEQSNANFRDFSLITIIHTSLGNIAYGTTPGYAEIRATLRSYLEEDMQELSKKAIKLLGDIAEQEDLEYSHCWKEEFPNTPNDNSCVNAVKSAANNLNLKIIEPAHPFKWSEDFGHFTHSYPGVLFGLGAGVKHAQLHNPDYDFPDEIIATGRRLFQEIIKFYLER